ncbi:MAG: hypothetical protein ACYS22_00650 [Planctomycetota bacterium]|jgi:hypothetical protein
MNPALHVARIAGNSYKGTNVLNSLDTRTRILIAVAAAALLITGTWLFVRDSGSEEDRVRSVIEAMIQGAEDKNVGDVMKNVSAEYKDGGGLDKKELRNMVRAFMLRGGFGTKIRVNRVSPTHVSITPDGVATAEFEAIVRTGEFVDSLRDAAHYRFEVFLHQRGGDWLVFDHKRKKP